MATARKSKKPATRRIATPGSATWHAMLDAAEFILREEGYAALSSRRVAECVDVKQRLVYYYFKTMDDLVVETFRRLVTRELARLHAALEGARPLRQLWDICIHAGDARMVSEFVALANRNEQLREEVVDFIEESRAIQAKALRGALAGNAIPGTVSHDGLAMLATSLALSFTREKALGITTGHRDLYAAIEAFIDRIEPPARTAKRKSR